MTNRPEYVYPYMFAGLIILQALLLFYWAATMPVASAYEGDIIFVAEEMLKSGNWLWPKTVENRLVYHTPVLPYMLAAAGHALVPFNLAGFRLFGILLYLPALWGFFSVIRIYLNARTAFYSSCIIACCLPFIWQMQLATPDGLLAILAAGAILGFYLLLKTNKQKYFWLLYLSLAAGMLIKGLPALVLPLLIMMVYLMFKVKMNGTAIKKLSPGKGVLLVAAIVLPWYAYAGFKSGGSWLTIFWDEFHRQQYFHENLQAEGAFYLPFLYIILMLLPFGVYFPRSFSYSWKYRFKKDFLLLSGLFVMIVLFFYAFSGTFYPHYLLPALPFAAVAIAYRFDAVSGRSLVKMSMDAEHALLALLAFLIPGACLYLLSEGSGAGFEFQLLNILLAAVLPAGTLITLWLWVKKRTDEGMAALVFSYILFFFLLLSAAQNNPDLHEWLQKILF